MKKGKRYQECEKLIDSTNNTIAVVVIVIITATIVFVLDVVFDLFSKYGINNLKSHIRGYNTVQVQDEHNHGQEHEDENKVTENVVNDIINNTVSE